MERYKRKFEEKDIREIKQEIRNITDQAANKMYQGYTNIYFNNFGVDRKRYKEIEKLINKSVIIIEKGLENIFHY